MSKKTGALFHYRIKSEEIYLVALCQQQICQYSCLLYYKIFSSNTKKRGMDDNDVSLPFFRSDSIY